jgi:hypothetical protein
VPEYFVAIQSEQGFQYLGHTQGSDAHDAVTRVSANHRVSGSYLAIDVANVEEFAVSFDAPQVVAIPQAPPGG